MAIAPHSYQQTYCKRSVIILAPTPTKEQIKPEGNFSTPTGLAGVERRLPPLTLSKFSLVN